MLLWSEEVTVTLCWELMHITYSNGAIATPAKVAVHATSTCHVIKEIAGIMDILPGIWMLSDELYR